MSCISPAAPFGDTALGSKLDSTRITARTRSGSMPWRLAMASIGCSGRATTASAAIAGGKGGWSVISSEPSGWIKVKISAPQGAVGANAASATDPSAMKRLHALAAVFETRNPLLPSRFLRRLHHATANEGSTITAGRSAAKFGHDRTEDELMPLD